MDFKYASYEELITLILARRDPIMRPARVIEEQWHDLVALSVTVQRLTQRLREPQILVRADVGHDDPPSAPSHEMLGMKPIQPVARPPGSLTCWPHGYASRRMVSVAGNMVGHRRKMIGLALAPVEVTEHIYLARRCPCCRQRRHRRCGGGARPAPARARALCRRSRSQPAEEAL